MRSIKSRLLTRLQLPTLDMLIVNPKLTIINPKVTWEKLVVWTEENTERKKIIFWLIFWGKVKPIIIVFYYLFITFCNSITTGGGDLRGIWQLHNKSRRSRWITVNGEDQLIVVLHCLQLCTHVFIHKKLYSCLIFQIYKRNLKY